MKLALEQLEKLDECRWLIPKGTKPGMRTDALIYADEALLKQILTDLSLEQAINVAFLPGIVGRSLAMPDIPQGYGFPIGGAAAAFGLRPEQVVVLIHCGSRGFGHQVCTDYLKRMGEAMQRHHIELPDRPLALGPPHPPGGPG